MITNNKINQMFNKISAKQFNESVDLDQIHESDDGWDEQVLKDIGLTDLLEKIGELGYALTKCIRRGCPGGQTYAELAQYLNDIADEMTDAASQLEQMTGPTECIHPTKDDKKIIMSETEKDFQPGDRIVWYNHVENESFHGEINEILENGTAELTLDNNDVVTVDVASLEFE